MAKYSQELHGDVSHDAIDGITYDRMGRMQYHKDFHHNHAKAFSLWELIYIAKYYLKDGARSVGFALGRTEVTIMLKFSQMQRSGDLVRYRKVTPEELEIVMRIEGVEQ